MMTGHLMKMKYNTKLPIFCIAVSKCHNPISDTIDATQVGDAPWKSFQACVDVDLPDDAPSWRQRSYDIYYRDPDVIVTNLLDNPNFVGQFDTTPYVHLDAHGHRRWSDFMSANFSYRRCVCLHLLILI
jgi:Plavaka transposase